VCSHVVRCYAVAAQFENCRTKIQEISGIVKDICRILYYRVNTNAVSSIVCMWKLEITCCCKFVFWIVSVNCMNWRNDIMFWYTMKVSWNRRWTVYCIFRTAQLLAYLILFYYLASMWWTVTLPLVFGSARKWPWVDILARVDRSCWLVCAYYISFGPVTSTDCYFEIMLIIWFSK